MHLTPREQEKLLIYVAGQLAKERKARRLKLNHPEAVAFLTAAILEAIRDGRSGGGSDELWRDVAEA